MERARLSRLTIINSRMALRNGDDDMEMTSSLNNHITNPTIIRIIGPILFSLKRIFHPFLSYLHRLIEYQAFGARKLKGRPIIIIMRPTASLTGC